jgi:CBS domain containing-hemolysin-like protein
MLSTAKPRTLTYLGFLPFLLALLIAVYGHFGLSEYLSYELRFSRFKSYMVAHTYGAVIVAFLGGIQWGISLHNPTNQQYFIVSNVLALLAWVSLFMFASLTGVALITTAFVMALWVDRHAFHNGLLPGWFWTLRKRISLLVISSLIVLMLING